MTPNPQLAARLRDGSATADDLQMAARCVEAWTKLEAMVRECYDIGLSLCCGGEIRCMEHGKPDTITWGTTALAAVEAQAGEWVGRND